MSRGKDLIGVLKGVKSVGKKIAKTKKADLDNLVRGTTLRETVDGVAVTLSRIVKAVDQMQKTNASGKATHQRPSSRSGASSSQRETSAYEKTKSDSSDQFASGHEEASNRSLLTRVRGDLMNASALILRRSSFPSSAAYGQSTSSLILGNKGRFLRHGLLSRLGVTSLFLHQERSFSSSAILSKDESSYSDTPKTSGRPTKRPTAADIKKRLKAKPKLPSSAKENRVPTGRVERLASFSSLAAGLALGAGVELTKRAVGLSAQKTLADSFVDTSVVLNPANAKRIVDTLCKVRGAALKLGQMLSIADNDILPPELQMIFERVRQSADFMPWKQTQAQLIDQLGADWRSKFSDFSERPFAAASIGQVHAAQLNDGTNVAVKIQYPGVAEGIDSDLNNLVTLMNATKMFPDSLFLDEIVRVARKELSWEVDYIREAAAYKYFANILKEDPVFFAPRVFDEVSAERVLTTEMVDGVSLEQACDLESQEKRNMIGEAILRLTLTELFRWRVMQTDPNWSNFLYVADEDRIGLIDFGANRFFATEFVDNYIQVINSAANGDKQGIIDWSQKVGFLTGFESKKMKEAHADSVMILGEGFHKDEAIDFASQTMIKRVAEIVPAVLKERLRAPPEEVYSVHRKLGGVFLLCTRLKCRMPINHLWQDIWSNYEFGRPDLKEAILQYGETDPQSVSEK